MRNRVIGRARMFMGVLLLLVAVVTWGIGSMMSPHGETAARGTEYLRSTVVTFKRNSAIGTLILSALVAWLLFPTRRPKWLARDWALTGLLALLFISSIYTLVWLRPSESSSTGADENLAILNVDSNANASAADIDPTIMNAELLSRPTHADSHPSVNVLPSQSNDRLSSDKNAQSVEAGATDEQADAERNVGSPDDRSERANNQSDANRD